MASSAGDAAGLTHYDLRLCCICRTCCPLEGWLLKLGVVHAPIYRAYDETGLLCVE